MSSKHEEYRKAMKKAADDERMLQEKLRAEKAAEIAAGKKPAIVVPKKKKEMDRILPPRPFTIREQAQTDREKIPPPERVEKAKPVKKAISKVALRKELQDMVTSEVDPLRSDMSIIAVPTEETTALEVLQPSFDIDVPEVGVLESSRPTIVVGLSSSATRLKAGGRKVNPRKTPIPRKQNVSKAVESSGKEERVSKKRKLTEDIPSETVAADKEAETLAKSKERTKRLEVIPFRMDPKYNPFIASCELISLKPRIRQITYKDRNLYWKQISEERLAAEKARELVREGIEEGDTEDVEEERESEEEDAEERGEESEEIEVLSTEYDQKVFVPNWDLRNRDSVLLSPASAIEFLDNSSTPGDVEVLREIDRANLKTNLAKALCEVIRFGWEGFQRWEELEIEKAAESSSVDQIRRSLDDYLEEIKKKESNVAQRDSDNQTSKAVVRSLEDKLADLRRKNSYYEKRIRDKNKIINVSAGINSDLRETNAELQVMYDLLKKRYKQTLSQLNRRENTIDILRSKIESLKINHGEGCSYVPQIGDESDNDAEDEDLDGDEGEDAGEDVQAHDDKEGDDSDPE